MTFLQLVNKVLVRLRETQVSTVNQTAYSTLIAEFVNQTKREVEDAWNWNALRSNIQVNTVQGTYNYTLTGFTNRGRIIDVFNVTKHYPMRNASRQHLDRLFLLPVTVQQSSPVMYGFNGVDASGNYKVDLYPVPDAAYTLQFNVVDPQDELVNDSDVLLVPTDPIILGAYSKAIRERGEDGGNAGFEVQAQYASALGSAIAEEVAKFPEETIWSSE